jgi:hypothetical protein
MVVAAVDDVGVGVDVMAPFSLSSDTMDGWTASFVSPVLIETNKQTKNP